MKNLKNLKNLKANILTLALAFALTLGVTLGLSGCSMSTVNNITNKLTTVAKIGTRSYEVAKIFYKSGRTILVSGGIYDLLSPETQAKLKALDTSLSTYDTFRNNVITIIKEEVQANEVLVTETEETLIISTISEETE